VAVDDSTSASGGDVYVGDVGTDTVYKSPEGTCFSESGSGTPDGPFREVDGVALDGSGKVWVSIGRLAST